jgi:hypothetical protein
MSAAELYYRYTLFGEDPFIIMLDASATPAPFCGWDYAKERCPDVRHDLSNSPSRGGGNSCANSPTAQP